jgi:peptidyl-prolyl cis-trans isomerase D
MAEGKAFTDVAKDKGLQPSDYDLGFVTRDKIVDPAVAETAFSIAENSTSPIIDGRFGPVIVRVRGVQEEITIPFDDVKADIKQQLALQRAAADILNLRDGIEDARAGGASLTDAAAKYELKVVTVPAMDSGGKDPEGNSVDGLPVAVLTGAFAAEVGAENDPVEPDQTSFAWYEVTGVTPPRDRTLEEVRDKVVAAWKDAERQKAVDNQAADIKKRLDAGESLDAIAQGLSLTVQKAPAVTRLTQPSGELSAAALTSAFAGGKGASAIAQGAEPTTKLVLTVDAINQPPYFSGDPTLATIKQQLNTQIVTDMIATYATELQRQTDVRFNQAAIAAAVGVSPTP